MNSMLNKVKGGLIVSCQALTDEPLHSEFIMSRLALAAKQGGAVGIRANTQKDIKAIKEVVDLPVVGIIKRDYDDSRVYITPTISDVMELLSAHPEMIALDATFEERPNGETLSSIVSYIKTHYPDTEIMADIATLEQAIEAEKLGFDCVSTTLRGYTEDTQGMRNDDHNFKFVRLLIQTLAIPVIAEGNIDTPEKAAACLDYGCHAVVVGGAITRPKQITEKFVKAML
ncbi:N-acetylmannosamine-6-phosphate 2-epimerase [Vibrio parahaemolyticus]|uniref:N-acetylmannosamine-6-phosphate 2-epimerase n=1 Tax=Vibrio parahaemolyticus TaxID=670 RepID=UPI0004057A6E|nr:N-acetylmannosamine-6-phosphate 2-epimerase [Vibrio parahaemolyticus]